jgi:hypothetical protein
MASWYAYRLEVADHDEPSFSGVHPIEVGEPKAEQQPAGRAAE